MSGISGRADEPRSLLGGVVAAAAGRGWKGFAAPAAFLLAATIAVVVFRPHHPAASPAPTPSHVRQAKPPAAPAARRFYSVAAGDTLTAIATKTSVPLLQIRALNPGLKPTALFIGEKIRLR